MNCFVLLDLPEIFALDELLLKQHYFKLQRRYHPDRMTNKTPQEKQRSMQQSMDVNQAYDTLKSPLKRAQHLLQLQGISVNTEKDTVKPDMELLTEIMELREGLEEVSGAQEITSLLQATEDKITNILQQLAIAFSAHNYMEAAQTTLRLGYLTKLQDEMRTRLAKAA